IMIGSFGGPGGMAHFLILALWEHGAKELTLVSNTGGITMTGGFSVTPGLPHTIDHSILIENGLVKKLIGSFPVSASPSRVTALEKAFREGNVEVESVPQGTLAERIRAAGAGIPAFYTPTGSGTSTERGKEKRTISGREYLLEYALPGDFAFVRAWKADTLGNLIYRGSSRAFNDIMCTAARVAIAEVDEVVEPDKLDSERIDTPGLYIDRIVQRPKDWSPILAETYHRRTGRPPS
ncbi:MAG: 3-oxoacid CoA-transferase subunit A, partial [Chloroflexi bacterium]|nr:3-oxoacid CoA-transferase subunit A [Chloroflexota bacterium]